MQNNTKRLLRYWIKMQNNTKQLLWHWIKMQNNIKRHLLVRLTLQFLKENALAGDLGLGLPVGRARHAEAYRARRPVPR